MMIESELLQYLSEIDSDSVIYLKTDPEYIDFTDKYFSFNIEIFSRSKKITVNIDKNNFSEINSILKVAIFLKNKKLITWNIKNYFSYYKKITGKDADYECQILDLKILERICGNYSEKAPAAFKEALDRFSVVYHNNWNKINKVYKEIHYPLITKVVPSIENAGIVDLYEKNIKYCYYEIEGQENGRLSSFNCFENSFLPLNLKIEDKQKYKPLSEDNLFLLFDYKNMEVSVLEFLTKDRALKDVLDMGDDFYESLYKKIVNPDNFDQNKRKKMKMIFLPFIYGAGVNKISETCKTEVSKIKIITERIKKEFPKTFTWLENYSKINDNGYYTNLFGKRRKIEQSYKSINFIVQSTASMFCLDKLIDLQSVYKNSICFYVHDAYCLYSNKKELESNIEMIKNILLQESKFLNNIHLSISCKYGSNLNEMKEFEGEVS
jgi:hypothetical protein